MAPALMFPEPRRDASQVVNAPIDPAQALLRRYTHWERRLENLISFFSLIQRFQKIHSKQYLDLSELAGHRFGLEENFHQDGIISIWRGLKDKTAELGRFYDGLQESYNNTVINELNMRLQDIQMFKAEINRLRTNEAAAVAKKQKKFLDSVGDLGVSINSMRTRSAKLDPFVVNRKCVKRLRKWVDMDNELKLHVAGIQQKCADFEFKLVPKIKEVGNAYVTITQNEFQTASGHFSDLKAMCEHVPQGLDWQHFHCTEASFRSGTMQLDASRLDYTHSGHPLISPAIWGNIDIWNKFVRRWDLGSFCVTRTGYLMQYRHPFTQFEDNIKPKMSIRLATTVLGDLIKSRGEATFTLSAHKYSFETPSHGPVKYVKAPLTMAKHAMSKLTTVKFRVGSDIAQDWYDAIGAFAQKQAPKLRRSRRSVRRVVTVSANNPAWTNTPARTNAPGHDDDDEDDDDETDNSDTSSTSVDHAQPDEWDNEIHVDAEEHNHQSVADRQPSHITHNPW